MNTKNSNKNEVRIIGGTWRSRKISIADDPGVRPTPNRIRETLFNWLTDHIQGAHCLDLFAGSGALGFEALSRGATEVVMIDRSPEVIAQLKENAKRLGTDAAHFYCLSVPCDNPPSLSAFDIIFLDPPFHKDMIAPICQWLNERHWVKPNTLIYIESEPELTPLPIPHNWQILKSKQASQVAYHLLYCGA